VLTEAEGQNRRAAVICVHKTVECIKAGGMQDGTLGVHKADESRSVHGGDSKQVPRHQNRLCAYLRLTLPVGEIVKPLDGTITLLTSTVAVISPFARMHIEADWDGTA